jgi:hypothetical protein
MTNLTGLSAQDDEEKRDESDQDVHNVTTASVDPAAKPRELHPEEPGSRSWSRSERCPSRHATEATRRSDAATGTASRPTGRPALEHPQVGDCGLFKLTMDSVPAELSSAVPNWRAGDTIPLGHKTLRVVGIRDDDADQPPVPVVEEA